MLFSYNRIPFQKVHRVVDDIIKHQTILKGRPKEYRKRKLKVFIGRCTEEELPKLAKKFKDLNDETVTVYLYKDPPR
jgi:hypothetical protein